MKSYTETVNQRAQEHKDKLIMSHDNIRGAETDAERQERTGLSSLRLSDDASKAVQKTPHRVSLDSIIEKIAHTDYVYPDRHPHMTLAIITMQNGFIFVGKATPADPTNFDEALGKKFAYEDAIRQIWPMEAYLLREKMACQDQTSST